MACPTDGRSRTGSRWELRMGMKMLITMVSRTTRSVLRIRSRKKLLVVRETIVISIFIPIRNSHREPVRDLPSVGHAIVVAVQPFRLEGSPGGRWSGDPGHGVGRGQVEAHALEGKAGVVSLGRPGGGVVVGHQEERGARWPRQPEGLALVVEFSRIESVQR